MTHSSTLNAAEICTRYKRRPVYHNADGYYWQHGGYFATLPEVCTDIDEHDDDSDERVFPRPSDTESLPIPAYLTER